MRREVQHIRRSQFVFIYGPGAIIESKNGPRIIPSINFGLNEFLSSNKFEAFEITDSRLRIAIWHLKNNKARIFNLPSNAALGVPDTQSIYKTYVFPVWRICYGGKKKHDSILFGERFCPLCKSEENSIAVRFVVACINGHLDEIPWNGAVHADKEASKTCKSSFFFWKTGGSSLSDIIIECPNCHCKTNMGQIYQQNFFCTGRFPEKEEPLFDTSGSATFTKAKRPFSEKCEESMKVIQRQSSSIRIPETITLLTIPEYDNAISNLLQNTIISSSINMAITSPFIKKLEMDELINWIKTGLKDKIPKESIQKIENYLKENNFSTFCNLFKKLNDEEKTPIDFIYEELESLSSGPQVTENFNMGQAKRISIDSGVLIHDFDIFPINKIKTVTAQMAYKRIPYTKENQNPKPVHISTYLDKFHWYPGFEGLGEGLFITFSDKSSFNIRENPAFNEWKNSKVNSNEISSFWNEITQDPLFVWLHTLSHSIIKTLSIFAGYSSASLRERVYINREADNGGILIYTTSPGEDGSMGGLVGAVEDFEAILDKVIENIKYCSNDPLCGEVRKTPERMNGAACHSCLLISETSCEHRNMWLDLHIVRGD